MKTLEDYIKDLRSKGKGYFITQEALSTLRISRSALNENLLKRPVAKVN